MTLDISTNRQSKMKYLFNYTKWLRYFLILVGLLVAPLKLAAITNLSDEWTVERVTDGDNICYRGEIVKIVKAPFEVKRAAWCSSKTGKVAGFVIIKTKKISEVQTDIFYESIMILKWDDPAFVKEVPKSEGLEVKDVLAISDTVSPLRIVVRSTIKKHKPNHRMYDILLMKWVTPDAPAEITDFEL
jgi:hypothetical protein